VCSPLRLLVFLTLGLAASPVPAQELTLTLATVDNPAFSMRQVSVHLQDIAGGPADIDIGRLVLGGQEFHDLKLHCGRLQWSPEQLDCRDGKFTPHGRTVMPLAFTYSLSRRALDLRFTGADLAGAAALPQLAGYKPAGRFDARLTAGATKLDMKLTLADASFSRADGGLAADHVSASLTLKAERPPGRPSADWVWQATVDWPRGEAYWAPLYRAGGMQLGASGRFAPGSLSVDRAALSLAGIGNASGELQWGQGKLIQARVETGSLDLAAAVAQLLQPFLDLHAGPKLAASGRGNFAAEWRGGVLDRLDLGLDDAGISVGADGFALSGVRARIPWRRDDVTQAEFSALGGRFERLPLGAFTLPVAMRGFEFNVGHAGIPLLDGELLFDGFHAARNNGQWQWRLGAALTPVSMPLFTATLGLPRMEGLLSASIPAIGYVNSTLSLDGALVVSVFDGYLAATGLKVVDPLGRLPRLQGDVELRHLDLGMLTETFSFGDITGYIDGDIRGLELQGTRPLAFAADIRSSPGDYKKRISQRAVQNISSLGGAGAGAAIQRSFLGFFKTFGYRRIGLSCRLLANGVCEMGGIGNAPGGAGYLIVEGGGIPALSVIGYNRRVHWDELVSRLQAVIAGNSKPVIQ